MAYRYEPQTEDVEKLADLLSSRMPNTKFQFQLDQTTGQLRVRGCVGRTTQEYRYYEQLLRNEHEPEQVVETFENKFKCQPQLVR